MDYIWEHKYRPKTIDECILPDRIKQPFKHYIASGKIPNLLLTGDPGIGKTSAALALCNELNADVLHINASDERGIDVIRTKIKDFATTAAMGAVRAVILDESDFLTQDAQAALRVLIDEFSFNCAFIFVCNYENKLIPPLHSRTAVIDFNLKPSEKKEMAALLYNRLQEILNKEKVEYTKDALIPIIIHFFPDYRRTINELQRFSATGPINAGVVAKLGSVHKLDELMKFLKEKSFNDMRKWVGTNSDMDYRKVYRAIYDSLKDNLKPHDVPKAVVLIARYQYMNAFVQDPEINFAAFCTELMTDCEFK